MGVGIQVFWVLIEESPFTVFDSTFGLEGCETRPNNSIENSRAQGVLCTLDKTLKQSFKEREGLWAADNIALIPLQVHLPFQTTLIVLALSAFLWYIRFLKNAFTRVSTLVSRNVMCLLPVFCVNMAINRVYSPHSTGWPRQETRFTIHVWCL